MHSCPDTLVGKWCHGGLDLVVGCRTVGQENRRSSPPADIFFVPHCLSFGRDTNSSFDKTVCMYMILIAFFQHIGNIIMN